MIFRQPSSGAFEFVVIAALRAHQLQRGCTPRVLRGHAAVAVAQEEVAAGLVTRLAFVPPPVSRRLNL